MDEPITSVTAAEAAEEMSPGHPARPDVRGFVVATAPLAVSRSACGTGAYLA